MNPEALAAREDVEGGATLYKGIREGVSNPAEESQFFALESPEDPDFAERYGIPEENLPFDSVATGTLREGAPFITREAPGVGSNDGGGIEVVMNAGDLLGRE